MWSSQNQAALPPVPKWRGTGLHSLGKEKTTSCKNSCVYLKWAVHHFFIDGIVLTFKRKVYFCE